MTEEYKTGTDVITGAITKILSRVIIIFAVILVAVS